MQPGGSCAVPTRTISSCTASGTSALVRCWKSATPAIPSRGNWRAGADLRTDLPRYAVYREGVRGPDVTDARDLWQPDSVAFLISSGISFDQALEDAGVPTLRTGGCCGRSIPTKPAGPFRGNMVVTMRWLSPEQSIRAVQVTSRYPFNHGAPDSHWESVRNRRRPRASARRAAGR